MKANTKELLAAIRKKCMDCCGNMRSEVQSCNIKECPLYPYRRNAIEGEDRKQAPKNADIVHCGECKFGHAIVNQGGDISINCVRLPASMLFHTDWYCSAGEPREE